MPETQKIKGISVESSIHTVKENTVIVSIANNLDSEVAINKGSLICDVESYRIPVIEVDERNQECQEYMNNSQTEIEKKNRKKK